MMRESRELPHSLEAERVVLGVAITYPDNRDELLAAVTGDMFFGRGHKCIWDLLCTMTQQQMPIGLESMAVYAGETGKLDHIGGVNGLIEATDAHSATPMYFAAAVKRCYMLRQLISLGREISEGAYAADADPDQMLATVSQNVTDLITTGTTSSEVRLADSIQQVMISIDDRIKSKGTAGITTGFPDLDSQVGGLRPGQLIVLAARPAVGKSALALNIAHAVADKVGAALFVSLEMAHTEQAERVLAYESGLSSQTLQSSEWTHVDKDALFAAVNDVGDTPLLFLDNAFDLDSIVNKCRAIHRKHTLHLIVIDYLQLCEVNGIPESQRERAVAKLSRSFKRLAQELQLPVIALSQLNRDLEKRQNKMPVLADLRESGAIEQDANVVLFIHRPDVFDVDDRPGEADVIVAKNRNGSAGLVRLKFRKDLTRFESADVYDGGF